MLDADWSDSPWRGVRAPTTAVAATVATAVAPTAEVCATIAAAVTGSTISPNRVLQAEQYQSARSMLTGWAPVHTMWTVFS